MRTPTLVVRKLNYKYNDGFALSDISFSATGVCALVGKNGSGKSTLLSCLSGRSFPHSGTLYWEGQLCPKIPGLVGYLPATDFFLPRLTVRQNLEYLSYIKTNDRKVWARYLPLIQALELDPFMDHLFSSVSLGTKKKGQLVSSLIGDPRLILWDEPDTGLDPPAQNTLRKELMNLKDSGTCVLLATHNIMLVRNACDRAVVLADGNVKGEFEVQNIDETFLA